MFHGKLYSATQVWLLEIWTKIDCLLESCTLTGMFHGKLCSNTGLYDCWKAVHQHRYDCWKAVHQQRYDCWKAVHQHRYDCWKAVHRDRLFWILVFFLKISTQTQYYRMKIMILIHIYIPFWLFIFFISIVYILYFDCLYSLFWLFIFFILIVYILYFDCLYFIFIMIDDFSHFRIPNRKRSISESSLVTDMGTGILFSL